MTDENDSAILVSSRSRQESHSCLRWRSPDLERGRNALAMAERRLGLADNLARVFPDRRDPTRVVHSLVDMFRTLACSRSAAATRNAHDDLDRRGPVTADIERPAVVYRNTGRDLCSQPTLSRLENAPRLRDVIRLHHILVDAWMDSYPREPASVTLDIDDTCDVVHGHQQLSLFNAELRRTLLSTDPHLRHGEEPAGGGPRRGPAERRAASRCVPICAA